MPAQEPYTYFEKHAKGGGDTAKAGPRKGIFKAKHNMVRVELVSVPYQNQIRKDPQTS